MRKVLALVSGALLAVGLVSGCDGGESCAIVDWVPPTISVDPAQGAPGDSVTVSVARLFQVRNGCIDGEPADDDLAAGTATVVFGQGGAETDLGTVAGDGADHSGVVTVVVPRSAAAGSASLTLRPTTVDTYEPLDPASFTVLA